VAVIDSNGPRERVRLREARSDASWARRDSSGYELASPAPCYNTCMSDSAPKRRWTTIVIRAFETLGAIMVALYAVQGVTVSLWIAGFPSPRARVAHAQGLAFWWSILFLGASIAASVLAVSTMRAYNARRTDRPKAPTPPAHL
jgi:hypothetical protein